MAIPWMASSPCCATSVGARSSTPTLEPPDTMMTSASACSASRIASGSSGTRPGKSTRPPSRSTRAASMGPLASAIRQSLRLRSRRQQLVARHDQSHARPAEHRHVSDADRTQHAEILRTQHPARWRAAWSRGRCPLRALPTCLPGETAARALMDVFVPASSSIHSAGSTASHPLRHRRASHDSNGLADRDRLRRKDVRERVADHRQRTGGCTGTHPRCFRR